MQEGLRQSCTKNLAVNETQILKRMARGLLKEPDTLNKSFPGSFTVRRGMSCKGKIPMIRVEISGHNANCLVTGVPKVQRGHVS